MPINALQLRDLLPQSKESAAAITGGSFLTITTVVLLIITATHVSAGTLGFSLIGAVEVGSFALFSVGLYLYIRKKEKGPPEKIPSKSHALSEQQKSSRHPDRKQPQKGSLKKQPPSSQLIVDKPPSRPTTNAHARIRSNLPQQPIPPSAQKPPTITFPSSSNEGKQDAAPAQPLNLPTQKPLSVAPLAYLAPDKPDDVHSSHPLPIDFQDLELLTPPPFDEVELEHFLPPDKPDDLQNLNDSLPSSNASNAGKQDVVPAQELDLPTQKPLSVAPLPYPIPHKPDDLLLLNKQPLPAIFQELKPLTPPSPCKKQSAEEVSLVYPIVIEYEEVTETFEWEVIDYTEVVQEAAPPIYSLALEFTVEAKAPPSPKAKPIIADSFKEPEAPSRSSITPIQTEEKESEEGIEPEAFSAQCDPAGEAAAAPLPMPHPDKRFISFEPVNLQPKTPKVNRKEKEKESEDLDRVEEEISLPQVQSDVEKAEKPEPKKPFTLPPLSQSPQKYIADFHKQVLTLVESAENTLAAFCNAYHANQEANWFILYDPKTAAEGDVKKIRTAFKVLKDLIADYLSSQQRGFNILRAILSIIAGSIIPEDIGKFLDRFELLPQLNKCCDAFKTSISKETLKEALIVNCPLVVFNEQELDSLMDKVFPLSSKLAGFFKTPTYLERDKSPEAEKKCMDIWIKNMKMLAGQAKLSKKEELLFFQLTLPQRVDPTSFKIIPFEDAFASLFSTGVDLLETLTQAYEYQTQLKDCCYAFKRSEQAEFKKALIRLHPQMDEDEINSLTIKVWKAVQASRTKINAFSRSPALYDNNSMDASILAVMNGCLGEWILILQSIADQANLDEKERELFFELGLPPLADRATSQFRPVSSEEVICRLISKESKEEIDPSLLGEVQKVILSLKKTATHLLKAPLTKTSKTLLLQCRTCYRAWLHDKKTNEGKKSDKLHFQLITACVHFVQQRALESKLPQRELEECVQTIIPRMLQILSLALSGKLDFDKEAKKTEEAEKAEPIDPRPAIEAIRGEYGDNEQANEKALEKVIKEELGEKFLGKLAILGVDAIASKFVINKIYSLLGKKYLLKGLSLLPAEATQKKEIEEAIDAIVDIIINPILYAKFKEGKFHDHMKKVVHSKAFRLPLVVPEKSLESVVQYACSVLRTLEHLLTGFPFQVRLDKELAALKPPVAPKKPDCTVTTRKNKHALEYASLASHSKYFSKKLKDYDLRRLDCPQATDRVLLYLSGKLKDEQIKTLRPKEVLSLLKAAAFFKVQRLVLLTQQILINYILDNQFDVIETPAELHAKGWNFLADCQAVVYEANYRQRLGRMLEELPSPTPPQTHDFTVIFLDDEDKRTYPFDRALLEAQSEYFRASHAFKEGQLETVEMDPSLLPQKTLLVMDYLSGQLKDTDIQYLSSEDVKLLLEAADFFQVRRLQLLAQGILIDRLSYNLYGKPKIEKALADLKPPTAPEKSDLTVTLQGGEKVTEYQFDLSLLKTHTDYFSPSSRKRGPCKLSMDLADLPLTTPLVMDYLCGQLKDREISLFTSELVKQLLDAANHFQVKRLQLLTHRILTDRLSRRTELVETPEELHEKGWLFLAQCQQECSGISFA